MMHRRRHRTHRTHTAGTLLLAGGLLASLLGMVAGCGGNLTAGGLSGQADVAFSGDATGAGGSDARTRLVRAAESSERDNDPEGEIKLEFLLFLEAADGSSVPLSDTLIEVELDVEGDIEADAVSRQVPATRYTGLRIVFEEIEVEIDAGLVIDGVPILGAVDVEIEGSLPVVKPLDLEVEPDQRVALLVDLNAATWLEAVDPDTHVVDPTVFANAISVVVR